MVLEVQDDEEDCVAIDRWCAVGFVHGGHRSGSFSVSACGAVNYSLGLMCYSTAACTYSNLQFKWAEARKLIKHHMMGKLQTYAHSYVLTL